MRLNLKEQPTSLDPRKVHNIKDLSLVKQLYEGLMRADAEGNLLPALASSYSISEDGCCYSFVLREATWSNGEKITAYDFERSVRELLAPSFHSDYAFILFPIKNAKLAKQSLCDIKEVGITALDEKRLLIELERPTPFFLDLTAFPTLFPVHQSDPQLCSGPFTIKKLEPEFSLILEKNPLYWDQEAVALEGIHFTMIEDNHTEALLFEQGELDWLGLPLSHAIASEILGTIPEKESYAIDGSCWLTFNREVFPLHHLKIRQALSMSINRSQLITHVLQGGQQIATSLLPPSLRLNEEGRFFSDGNLMQAKKLLVEGCSELEMNELPPLRMVFPHSKRSLQIAQVIQSQIREALGIEILLEMKESHLFRQAVKEGDFDIAYSEWISDYHDPLSVLEIFTRSFYATGLAKDKGDEYVLLLEHASLEKEQDKRLQILRSAEAVLMDEMPIAPLYHYSFDYVKKPYVKGVALSPLGLADFKYARIE